MSIEEFVADEGDACDCCGNDMAENAPLFSDTSLRVRWRYCSLGCASKGYTDKSKKARFLQAVLGDVF